VNIYVSIFDCLINLNEQLKSKEKFLAKPQCLSVLFDCEKGKELKDFLTEIICGIFSAQSRNHIYKRSEEVC